MEQRNKIHKRRHLHHNSQRHTRLRSMDKHHRQHLYRIRHKNEPASRNNLPNDTPERNNQHLQHNQKQYRISQRRMATLRHIHTRRYSNRNQHYNRSNRHWNRKQPNQLPNKNTKQRQHLHQRSQNIPNLKKNGRKTVTHNGNENMHSQPLHANTRQAIRKMELPTTPNVGFPH